MGNACAARNPIDLASESLESWKKADFPEDIYSPNVGIWVDYWASILAVSSSRRSSTFFFVTVSESGMADTSPFASPTTTPKLFVSTCRMEQKSFSPMTSEHHPFQDCDKGSEHQPAKVKRDPRGSENPDPTSLVYLFSHRAPNLCVSPRP